MHSFRLVTVIKTVGVDEPTVVSPTIREPIKFSDLRLVGESDPKLHGFLYGYGEDEIKLTFTCEPAHNLISQQYYQYGSDLDVRFQIVFHHKDGTEEIDFEGVILGESIVVSPGRVEASIQQKSIHSVIDARWDSKVSMDANLTLDGKAIVPPSYIELRLPGQAIRQTLESNRIQREDFDTPAQVGVPALIYFILPNTDEVPPVPGEPAKTNTETITALKRHPGGVLAGITPEKVDPEKGGSFPFLKADADGTYEIQFDWVFTVEVSFTKRAFDIGAIRFKTWTLRPLMVVVKETGERTETEVAPRQGGQGEKTHLGRKTVEVHINQTLTLDKGDSVFIYTALYVAADKMPRQINCSVTALLVHIKLRTLTRAEPSLARVWFLSDAIRHVLRCIIDQPAGEDPILSSLLSSEGPFPGPASEYVVTNGASLRGVPKAPIFTLKQLIGVLSSLHAAGIQYKGDKVQIEEGAYFYQNSQMLEIDEVFSYREEVATDHLYNQVEVGYEKYPEDGPGVREEFNTIRTYQTPIRNYGQTLEIKCPLIGAGTAIEQVRTVQFAEQPTDSHAYDDDGFILHVQTAVHANLVKFQTLAAETFPGIPYQRRIATFFLPTTAVRTGVAITILTGPGAGAILIITNVISRSLLTGTRVEFITNETVPNVSAYTPITFRSGTEPVMIRTNERLEITGLSDPATVVNAELSPARIIRRHAPFLLNGLRYKPLFEEMKCTFFSQNGAMTSRVRAESPSLPGDFYKQTIRESGPIALGEIEKVEGRFFSPEWVYVTARVDRDDLKLLLAAMTSSDDVPEVIHRGYISVKNPDGEYVTGWLRMGGSIKYNPCSEVVEIKMLKRYQTAPTYDCDLYANWQFLRFETDPSADPNFYRFCRFLDFN
ncbi:hypothetical protein [Larkinella soli]|uniref:hypothetical protein n=1 Tax=Larkinella soli TaxID=1770527 RepID=UPI000FFCB103|nr:hypothetical protein [Larkinella soli]